MKSVSPKAWLLVHCVAICVWPLMYATIFFIDTRFSPTTRILLFPGDVPVVGDSPLRGQVEWGRADGMMEWNAYALDSSEYVVGRSRVVVPMAAGTSRVIPFMRMGPMETHSNGLGAITDPEFLDKLQLDTTLMKGFVVCQPIWHTEPVAFLDSNDDGKFDLLIDCGAGTVEKLQHLPK